MSYGITGKCGLLDASEVKTLKLKDYACDGCGICGARIGRCVHQDVEGYCLAMEQAHINCFNCWCPNSPDICKYYVDFRAGDEDPIIYDTAALVKYMDSKKPGAPHPLPLTTALRVVGKIAGKSLANDISAHERSKPRPPGT